MKFLRQKETKRKISFLMALAMMVSLLPVSPIAQAAVTKVENLSDNSNVRFAVNSTTATSAVIKVTPANEKEEFDKDKNKSATAVVATGSAANAATQSAVISFTDSKTGTFTVENLTNDIAIIYVKEINITLKDAVSTPTKTPTSSAVATSGPAASADPTDRPLLPNPNPGSSSAPGTSAAPTNAPGTSAAPTNAPGTSAAPTNAPGTSAAPTNAPETTPAPTKAPTTTVKVGNKVTTSNLTYQVTSVSGTRTVQFTGVKSKNKLVKIPATIKINGKTYKVTTIVKGALKNNKKVTKVIIGANINKIGQNAFKGCKNLKTIRMNTKKLTASKVKANAFKGIKKNATFKVPSGKVKKYKKIVQAKGAGKKVKVIKK